MLNEDNFLRPRPRTNFLNLTYNIIMRAHTTMTMNLNTFIPITNNNCKVKIIRFHIYLCTHFPEDKMKSSRSGRGQLFKAEVEAEEKSSKPRPRTKFCPRGQAGLEDLTSLDVILMRDWEQPVGWCVGIAVRGGLRAEDVRGRKRRRQDAQAQLGHPGHPQADLRRRGAGAAAERRDCQRVHDVLRQLETGGHARQGGRSVNSLRVLGPVNTGNMSSRDFRLCSHARPW